MSFTLVINAGGQSKRMGQPKALLALPPRQIPLLQHVLQSLKSLGDDTIIIANDPEILCKVEIAADIIVLGDLYPNNGPRGGIATGLSLCTEWTILVACDMPLVNPELFRYLQQLAKEQSIEQEDRWDAIVPVVNGFAEPLHALYHRRCLVPIERRLANGERRATCFYPDVKVRFVEADELRQIDPHLRSLINVNTPEEWRQVLTFVENSLSSE